jgi:hypothetical protein
MSFKTSADLCCVHSVGFVALIVANAASAADMGLPVKGRALEPAWD